MNPPEFPFSWIKYLTGCVCRKVPVLDTSINESRRNHIDRDSRCINALQGASDAVGTLEDDLGVWGICATTYGTGRGMKVYNDNCMQGPFSFLLVSRYGRLTLFPESEPQANCESETLPERIRGNATVV